MQFGDVWEGLIGTLTGCPPDLAERPVSGVVIDSRAVQPGAVFVALHGEKTDGHLHLRGAFERGALAAIAEAMALELIPEAAFISEEGAFLRSPSGQESPAPVVGPFVFLVPSSLRGLQKLASAWRRKMPARAIGITGSIGKTTTKETVANVLARRFVTLRSEGNLNNEIGLPLTLLRLTPKCQRVVLEMGMYALGEITQLCELARPQLGIVTNVGPTHLERLGTIERVAQAKAELVQALPPADEGGVAILNADDPLVLGMADLTRARVFTYGLNPASDLWADEPSSDGLEGIRFRLHYGEEALILHLPLLGRHSVHTALRSAAAGLVEGLSWSEIITGLQEVRGQLRLMVVRGLRETTLIDDTYNASPESMLAALNLLDDILQKPGQERQGEPFGEVARPLRCEVPSPPACAPQSAPAPLQGAGQAAPGNLGGEATRSIAVLGDMFELGAYEEEGHRLVGGRAGQILGPASHRQDKLVTVGQRARWIAEEALAAGMPMADVHVTTTNRDAIAVLQGIMRPGDIILVKGSRAAGMETIVDTLSRPGKRAESRDLNGEGGADADRATSRGVSPCRRSRNGVSGPLQRGNA